MNGAGDLIVCPSCERPSPSQRVTCWGCGASLSATATAHDPGPPLPDDPPEETSGGPPSPFGPPRPSRRIHDELHPPPHHRSLHARGDASERHYRVRKRRLRRRHLVAGAALTVVGSVILLAVYVVNAQTRHEYVGPGNAWVFSPTTLTAVTTSVGWQGGLNGTQVFVVYGSTGCIAHSGVVASGSGPSGQLQASLDPGTTYYLFACAGGNSEGMNFTVVVSGGVNVADVIAGVMVVLGVALLVVGARGATIVSRTRVDDSGTPRP